MYSVPMVPVLSERRWWFSVHLRARWVLVPYRGGKSLEQAEGLLLYFVSIVEYCYWEPKRFLHMMLERTLWMDSKWWTLEEAENVYHSQRYMTVWLFTDWFLQQPLWFVEIKMKMCSHPRWCKCFKDTKKFLGKRNIETFPTYESEKTKSILVQHHRFIAEKGRI